MTTEICAFIKITSGPIDRGKVCVAKRVTTHIDSSR